MPMGADSVSWTADPDSTGGDYGDTASVYACGFSGFPATCTRQIVGAGTLHVTAHVNGDRYTADQHIGVNTMQLTLAADKAYVPSPGGDTVTFTPRWSDGVAVSTSNWLWIPDAPPSTVGGDCETWRNPCRHFINQSGWMQVTATRNGVHRHAKVRVRGVPCTTGDSVLDNPDFRDAFTTAWSGSKPDSAPGQRVERGLITFDSAGHRRYQLNSVKAGDTPCYNYQSPDSIPSGWTMFIASHTHPFSVGDTLPSNCAGPGQTWPGTEVHKYSNRYGGPSGADWKSISGYIPGYVADKDSVYRMNPSVQMDSIYDARTNSWVPVPKDGWQTSYKSWSRVAASGCHVF